MPVLSWGVSALRVRESSLFMCQGGWGAADLGAGAEKSRRDLGGAEKNPVDV